MYTIPKPTPKIRLLKDTGEVWVFKNLEVAAKELLRLGYYPRYSWREDALIGVNFNNERGPRWVDLANESYHFHYNYIVRTDTDEIVTVADLRNALPRKKSRWGKNPKGEYRNGPVPFIHKPSSGGYHRSIRTTPERRAAVEVNTDEELIEYGIKVRPNRSFSNLPNSWDDIPDSRRGRGWKNFRKTQYKTPKK